MAIKKVEFRDAPVSLKPEKDRIQALEDEVAVLKTKTSDLEVEVEKLKPKP